MKPLDYILIALVAVCFVGAVVLMIRAKKKGRGCCSSGGCCGNCATCRDACAGKKREEET